MKDERLYGKFTLDFPEHPKIKPLSDAAFRALVEMTLWSRQQMTDGFVSKRLAIAKWGLESCLELLANDPSNPSLIEVENGYLIHDFAAHQTTKADLSSLSEKRKAAGSKGGKASAQARFKQVLEQNGSKTKPETETETDKEPTTNVVGSPVAKAPRKRAKVSMPEGFNPSAKSVETIRGEFPGVTDSQLDAEHRKFCDHAIQEARACAGDLGWNSAWRNWMRLADKRGDLRPGVRRGGSTTDQRVAQTQALKHKGPQQSALLTVVQGELA